MIPIRTDYRMTRTPWVNYGLVAANVLLFLMGYNGMADAKIRPWMLSPGDPQLYQFFSSVFLHGGWIHLIGNMVFLWVFDILGAALGSGGVAYWAHLGGFAAGVGLGCALLSLGWIEMDRAEQSLYDVFAGRT